MAGKRKDRAAGGRGALSNRSGRFESQVVESFDDGWVREPSHARDAIVKTRVTAEATRRIIATNDSPDVPFDRSINPYRGCEHGCVYCFARPSHAYLGLSPGLDFETRIFSKPDAAALLRRELTRHGYHPETIALGANTDPYQPAENRLRITRALLEVFLECRHPVGVVTKSPLVVRDLDLLRPLADQGLANVYVSVTSLDGELARRMEPRAGTPRERLRTISELAAAGIPVGLLASPMIPGLNDAELERIVEAAAAAGASAAGYIVLRLPGELKELFEEWLRRHYPMRAEHVLSLVRDTCGATLYDGRFGKRMRGSGAYADLIARRFDAARARHGLCARLAPLLTSRFRPPSGAEPRPRRRPHRQLDLFDDDAT